MRLIVAIAFLFLWNWAYGQSLDAIKENNKGARAFAEDPLISQKSFLNALALEPFNEHIKMNLGVSFEATEEYENALKSYLAIAKNSSDDKLKHQAYFNAGNASAKLKKIDQALDYFQKALEFDPESIETKTNIEILTQQQDGGGGEGEQENEDQDQNGDSGQNQNKNDESDQDQKQQPQPDQGDGEQKKQKKPQEFESQKLTKDDVRKILEELKNQEQDIRAKEFEKGPKDQPNSKDW